MSWKFLIFPFGYLLFIQPTHSAIETVKLFEDRTQSTASLAEFSTKMLRLCSMLGRRLPTRKTDDICVLRNVEDPIFRDNFELIKADYEDVIQFVPEAVQGNTYDFIADMRNYSIELYKAKKTVENAIESPEYQEFQEHHKAELIKLIGRFIGQMINVAERYWNSLSAEKRTDAQKQFYEKIQEIKNETDVEKGYDQLHILLMATVDSLRVKHLI